MHPASLKPGQPLAGAYDRHANGYRKLQSFYNTRCRYIRQNFRKEVAGERRSRLKKAYEVVSFLDPEWERKQIEKRLGRQL